MFWPSYPFLSSWPSTIFFLSHILSLTIFFLSHSSILFLSLILNTDPLPNSLPRAHFLSHKSQPPLFRVQPSSSLTAAHAAPHLGLPTPASTRRPSYAGLNMPVCTRRPNLLILTESRWPSLSLFNFSIISSLFFIFWVCLILNQCYCFNFYVQIKLGFWKNPCAWLFIFWVCLFFRFPLSVLYSGFVYFFLCLLS